MSQRAQVNNATVRVRHPLGKIFGLHKDSFDEKNLPVMVKYMNKEDVVIVRVAGP